jgi:hypothetical protein
MWLLLLHLACDGGTATDDGECPPAPTCPDCGAPALEEWELSLLEPTIERLREGVKPFGERPFGLCRGVSSCEQWLGPDAGALSSGRYYVRAEVQPPEVGAPWRVDFSVDCEGVDGGGQERWSKTYEVTWTGEDRGYPLEPMWVVEVPHPAGARDCTYRLTPVRPDGVKLEPWVGSYRTPAPEG